MTNTLRKIFILIFLSFVAFSSINAQSLRAYIKAADEAFAKNDYFTALVYYKRVLEVEPERGDIHFKYAESARFFHAYRIAEDAYEKITQGQDSMRFPLATFWLGSMKKNLGKYEEAEIVFNDYLEKFKRVNPRYSRRAEKNIIDCRWAKKMMRSHRKSLSVEHIKNGINSPYSEFGATFRDSTIYFSSMKFQDKKKMFYSKVLRQRSDGQIEELDFNTEDKFAANPTISFDGNRIYYTLCNYDVIGNINCEIVFRDRKYEDVWGEAQSLPAFINFPGFTATHPTIGYDKLNQREVLFFVSNRPGGKGKLDIWYSTVAPNGKFTRPVNHSIINSKENDVTPFFHSPTQTLYFSSDGYPGMGGYDIYKVKRSGRSWQTPVHMVYPLNSSYNDFYFSLNEGGEKSYFASNRIEALEIDEENEACCNDLFIAQLEPEKIELTKEEYFAIIQESPSSYAGNELDEPQVIIQNMDEVNLEDIPETILNDGGSAGPNDAVMNPKGDELKINEAPSNDNDFDSNLSREVFSLIFEVEVLDMNLEPLTGVTVTFLEKSKEINSRDFTKTIQSGNKVKFRIKNHVDYAVVLSKPGFETDTFSLDRENLITATELTLPFFMNEDLDAVDYIESPLLEELSEEVVTDSMLNAFLPLPLYFNNNEPDPESWSNTTNKNYEQTFLLYYSQKEKFKDRYARKFAPSQRTEALNSIDYFFDEDLKKNYEKLNDFSDQLVKFLEIGNKVTLGVQGNISSSSNNKYTALIDRRISSLNNHFKSYLGGRLLPYLDQGLLKIEVLQPEIITSPKTNGTYSPEASKLRKVEIKTIKFD